jgi:hypothetical protein
MTGMGVGHLPLCASAPLREIPGSPGRHDRRQPGRRGTIGRRARGVAPLLAALLPPLAPTPARADGPAGFLIEPAIGTVLPVGRWTDAPPERVDPYYESQIVAGDLLAPAFVVGANVGYGFALGAGDPWGAIGPELGLAYVIWDPDDPPPDEWGDGRAVDATRIRLLFAGRLTFDADWAWPFFRVGVGPEFSTAEESQDDYDSTLGTDTGACILVGAGLSFRITGTFGLTFATALYSTIHEADEDYDWDYDEVDFGYRSLEVDLSFGATWVL